MRTLGPNVMQAAGMMQQRPAAPASAGPAAMPPASARAGLGQRMQQMAQVAQQRRQQMAMPAAGGLFGAGFGQRVAQMARGAQQRRQQMAMPTAAPMGGGGAPTQARVAGYADGGKVIDRKPNGKKC